MSFLPESSERLKHKNKKMKIPDISKSKAVKIVIGCICALVLILLVFQAGMFVGYRKAMFAGKMSDGYFKTFEGGMGGLHGGSNQGFPEMVNGSFFGRDLPGGHGAAGKVIGVQPLSILVADSNNVEKEVINATSTIVRKFREQVSFSDIKIGDSVVVIGSPNDKGQIEAKFIRVMQ